MSKKAVQIIVGVFLFSLVYAILRYHVFGDTGLKDFPLYVLNKCLALSGFILLTLNFALGPAKALGVNVPDTWLASRKEIGTVSFMLILTHVLCSLLTFGSGGYYAKFFVPERGISAIGSWSMLLGTAAFVWLWLYNISFKTQQESDKEFLRLVTSRGSLIFSALLSAGHVSVMGYKAWMHPENWTGGMPPITLVAIVIFLVGFSINLITRP